MNRRSFLKFVPIAIGAVLIPVDIRLGRGASILTHPDLQTDPEPSKRQHIHGKQRNTPWPWQDNHRTMEAHQRGDMQRFWDLKASQTIRYAAYLDKF